MDDLCICCGNVLPEGRMVCWACEHFGADDATQEEQERPEGSPPLRLFGLFRPRKQARG